MDPNMHMEKKEETAVADTEVMESTPEVTSEGPIPEAVATAVAAEEIASETE